MSETSAARVRKPFAGSTDVLVPITEYDALRDRADRYEYALSLLRAAEEARRVRA